jgi:hypothetical protein
MYDVKETGVILTDVAILICCVTVIIVISK